jgi:hypothetical protein
MSKFFKYESKAETTPITGRITDAELMSLIRAELAGNLSILIDPKRKDSFDPHRINTWSNVVSDRVLYYVKNWMENAE